MTSLRERPARLTNLKSLSARARAKRWEELLRRFPGFAAMRILDLGGTPAFWRTTPVRPEHVTIVNMDRTLERSDIDESWFDARIGDACDPSVAPGRFDLVISNSLLEHIGPHVRRRQLAERIRSAGDRYWVQTPNRYFPLEPHWFFPGFQFLPFSARVFVTMTWNRGHRHTRDRARAVELVREVELIGPGEMRRLFPDGELWIERFLVLPKSLVAIRT